MTCILLMRQLDLRSEMMICLCSLQDLRNLYYPKRTVILSCEQWEYFHQNIDDEPNAFVFTLKESKAKIKSISHVLLHLCTHLHFTEKTGNELLFFPGKNKRGCPAGKVKMMSVNNVLRHLLLRES